MLRRNFLKTLPAGVGAVPFLPEISQSISERIDELASDLKSTSVQTDRWRRVREEFQLNPGLIHLNCGSIGATPRVVIDAVSNYLREIEGNPLFKTFTWGIEQMEEVRAPAAEFIGAGVDEVAFTRNTTEGMNAVAAGLGLEPGDQVLTTNHEHGGGMVCWQHLRKHRGIEIVYVEMPTPLLNPQQFVDLVSEQITPRTKVCSFCHIDTITGTQLPLPEIAAITRPRGIVLVCDGAQAPGMIPVDVKALGVDTYAFSGHKWMLAPKGNGLLYIRREMQDRVQPMFLHSGYSSYTASGGTRDIARILGFGATIDFQNAIGKDAVQARCHELNAYLRAQLEEIPDLRPLTPASPDMACGIQAWALEKGDRGEILNRLRDEHEILLKSAQGTYAYCEEEGLQKSSYNAIRFSTHIFNSEAEIDRAVDVFGGLVR
jgi:selenocysteine lyase/cysteine desulfurase